MFIWSFEYDVTELQIVFEAKTLTLMAASALWLCWTLMESLAWFLRLIEAPGSLIEYSLYKSIKQCFNNTRKTFILFVVSLKRAIFTHVKCLRTRGHYILVTKLADEDVWVHYDTTITLFTTKSGPKCHLMCAIVGWLCFLIVSVDDYACGGCWWWGSSGCDMHAYVKFFFSSVPVLCKMELVVGSYSISTPDT